MASVASICRSFGLSPHQQIIFKKLRAGKKVKPERQQKKSMRVLVECELAQEIKGEPGVFELAERGQPMSYHFAQSDAFEQIAPGVFKVKR
jgi:hypothetical protein